MAQRATSPTVRVVAPDTPLQVAGIVTSNSAILGDGDTKHETLCITAVDDDPPRNPTRVLLLPTRTEPSSTPTTHPNQVTAAKTPISTEHWLPATASRSPRAQKRRHNAPGISNPRHHSRRDGGGLCPFRPISAGHGRTGCGCWNNSAETTGP